MEKLFKEVWNIYPRKDKKKVSFLKFKKMFSKLNSFAKQNNISVYKVFENWLWAELNKKQILDELGKIIPEKKQFIPHFVTMLNQERWEDEPFTNTYGKEVKGYFDAKNNVWLKISLKPKVIESKLDKKQIEAYKKTVPITVINLHKKNIAEDNNHAESSKLFLEKKGISL